MIRITIDQHELHLLPGRAVWRPAARTLYVADIHIGKASAFASGGVPVGGNVIERSTVADLSRLTNLVVTTGARRVVILGDLLHAAAGRDHRTLEQLARWRRAQAGVEVVLVRGNHDHAAGDPPASAGIDCVDAPFDDAGVDLVHHPIPGTAARPVLAGHLHPAVRLEGAGDSLRAACFWLTGGAQLILPAFGGFTGRASISPRAGDRVFALAGDAVVEVPVVVAGSRRAVEAR